MNELDKLFESVIFEEIEPADVDQDDEEDKIFAALESTRKISIFDSEFVLEGEV